ncbi:MAG: sulfatase-like hydrolase/transferase [Phycisphaerae bacterium]
MGKAQTRREFLAKAAAAAAAATSAVSCRTDVEPGEQSMGKAKRPNIVFILADDLGYGDLSCYGATDVRTPVIDGLARDGVRFTSHYAAAPECSPTRTALFTGRYLHRVGGLECAIGTTNVGRYDDAIRLAERHELGLPVEQADLTAALRQAGYRMAVYGKWHLGYEKKFLPLRHGFEHFVGILGGHCDYFHHVEITGTHTLWENDEEIHRDEYMTDIITNESVAYLRREDPSAARAGQPRPFFLYVSYTAPHSPYQGVKDRSPRPVPKEQWNTGPRAKYVEMVEHMDTGIGKILQALADRGLADNTLVFFVSDNGADRTGRNTPFHGHKSSLYEGGIRVPCIARWPGVLPRGKVVDEPVITMDLSASIVGAAGASPPKGRTFDGIDILRHVRTGSAAPKRPLFWRARRGERTWRAVRDGPGKYLSRQDGEKFDEWLFDLESDPDEKDDIIASRPAEAARLKRLLAEWEDEVRHTRGREKAAAE